MIIEVMDVFVTKYKSQIYVSL